MGDRWTTDGQMDLFFSRRTPAVSSSDTSVSSSSNKHGDEVAAQPDDVLFAFLHHSGAKPPRCNCVETFCARTHSQRRPVAASHFHFQRVFVAIMCFQDWARERGRSAAQDARAEKTKSESAITLMGLVERLESDLISV